MSVKAIAVRGQPYFCASGKKTGVKDLLVDYLRFQVTYLTLKKDEVKGHIVQTLRKRASAWYLTFNRDVGLVWEKCKASANLPNDCGTSGGTRMHL